MRALAAPAFQPSPTPWRRRAVPLPRRGTQPPAVPAAGRGSCFLWARVGLAALGGGGCYEARSLAKNSRARLSWRAACGHGLWKLVKKKPKMMMIFTHTHTHPVLGDIVSIALQALCRRVALKLLAEQGLPGRGRVALTPRHLPPWRAQPSPIALPSPAHPSNAPLLFRTADAVCDSFLPVLPPLLPFFPSMYHTAAYIDTPDKH